MSVNERYQRDHGQLRRLWLYVCVFPVPLWVVSYFASEPAAVVSNWQWFSAASVVTLLAAIGTTIGAAVLGGMVLTDDPPLEGSNR